ncbi:MAG: hypothetical protein IJ874_01250 [Ruminococcus sp.]|nr:hypothetical protein [Ruminococcus sp.]
MVLLFVPFHKITGHYLPDEIAVTVFAVIGFIGLAMLLLRFMKNWFMDIPVGIYFSAMVMIFLNCGIWFSIGRTDFYETATASGFAFLTWGAYFLLRCGAVGGEKRSLLFTALSSLFFAVAVLCRPTLALYCICAAVMLLLAYPRFAGAAGDEKTADKGKVKKSVKGKVKKSGNGRKGKAAQPAKKPFFTRSGAIYIACAFVPMAALGIAQMLYNHARFGSFFEFGIQYSLTINDFTKAEFHPALSWIALFNYYLAPPAFSADYPQISTVFQRLGVNGFFYQDEATVNTSGLLWLIPPLWAYLAGGRALRQLPDRRTRLRTFGMVFFPCLLIPLTIVAVVWESGYSARYFADFSWQLMLGAYAVLFFLYSKAKDDTARTMYKIFFGTSLLWSMVVSGVQVFDFVFRCSGEHMDHPEMRYIVDSLFAFWR